MWPKINKISSVTLYFLLFWCGSVAGLFENDTSHMYKQSLFERFIYKIITMIPDKMLAYFSKFLFQICSRVGKTELLEVKRKWKKHIFPTFLQ